jgi:hypothetical protein
MTDRRQILTRWRLLKPYLDSRQRTIWAAAEAAIIPKAGCKLLASITHISAAVISQRRCALQLTMRAQPGSLAQPPRSRGGRKLSEVKDPEMLPCLERMLIHEIAGDPMTNQRWVRSSLRTSARD